MNGLSLPLDQYLPANRCRRNCVGDPGDPGFGHGPKRFALRRTSLPDTGVIEQTATKIGSKASMPSSLDHSTGRSGGCFLPNGLVAVGGKPRRRHALVAR
jgi:hypothetical protein